MENLDLFRLREGFSLNRILLCFNGPMSHGLIEEIGNALRNYLEADRAQPSAAMDVFGVYIELTQNIRHYAVARGYDDLRGSATVIVARRDNGHYAVQAGNLVEKEDGERLVSRINELAGMDKAQLKAAYKQQLRQPRGVGSGAGLGLIDVSRKATEPLRATLSNVDAGQMFFSVRAVI